MRSPFYQRHLDVKRRLYRLILNPLTPSERPDRYKYGIWTFTYKVIGDFKPLSLPDFRELLNKVDAHITGWPVWANFSLEELAPYAHDDVVECWLKDTQWHDASNSDFWWASPEGMTFLLRGYDDDNQEVVHRYNMQPGQKLDTTLPIWRIGECLLHAERLANALTGSSAQISRSCFVERISR